MNRRGLLLILPLLVAGCVSPPKVAAPRPSPPPPMLAPPPPAPLDWKDAPLTMGGWSYARDDAGSSARFGLPGTVPDVEMRCDSGARSVSLSRPAMTGGTMTITTSYGARSWTVPARADGRVAISLPARDTFLDQIASSRARFAIDGPMSSRLILPAWAEPIRVIEDCRG